MCARRCSTPPASPSSTTRSSGPSTNGCAPRENPARSRSSLPCTSCSPYSTPCSGQDKPGSPSVSPRNNGCYGSLVLLCGFVSSTSHGGGGPRLRGDDEVRGALGEPPTSCPRRRAPRKHLVGLPRRHDCETIGCQRGLPFNWQGRGGPTGPIDSPGACS